ncbi:MAG: HD domain-containing protein [Candidatus Aenigmarchaeota archaeon]|nr:HD domain-containing protein [Candidatus Aenigmarchaeota archaeon]
MDIVEEARKLAKEMSEKYGDWPSFESTEHIVKKGQELAQKLNVDEKIVIVSCYLIDTGLGKAVKEGKIKEHIKFSLEIANRFLDNFDLSKEDKEKIINSIAAHHGKIGHNSIESEIVKNADNFRFLDPSKIARGIYKGGIKYKMGFKETIELLKNKVEEKYNLVTLDICKEEAEKNYRVIKEFLNRVNI